jgi:hypothetical protein
MDWTMEESAGAGGMFRPALTKFHHVYKYTYG